MVVYLYLKSRFCITKKCMILDKPHSLNTLRLLQAECTLTQYQSVCTYFYKTLLRCRNATPFGSSWIVTQTTRLVNVNTSNALQHVKKMAKIWRLQSQVKHIKYSTSKIIAAPNTAYITRADTGFYSTAPKTESSHSSGGTVSLALTALLQHNAQILRLSRLRYTGTVSSSLPPIPWCS
jgi:predicted unusual protein kinase regulating ubiquinone biosynthesis (AarF/ABC1/UbiB family)